MSSFDKYDDIVTLDEVRARITELEDEVETAFDDEPARENDKREFADLDSDDVIEAEIGFLTDEDRIELIDLRAFVDEAESFDDDSFINDNYFETYAEELAYDIGAISRDASWPLTHIDWEAAADSLKQDYTSIEFQGQTFWAR